MVCQWTIDTRNDPLGYYIISFCFSITIIVFTNYNMKLSDSIASSKQAESKPVTIELKQSASSPSRIKLGQKPAQQSPSQRIQAQVMQSYFQNQSPPDAATTLQQTPDFRQHCKSCLRYQQQRIHYETCIQDISCELQQQRRAVSALQEQIRELKLQEEYLMNTIQHMREKHNNEASITDNKLDKILKHKQQQLNFANKQVTKLKEWLREQKSQVFRSIECVKMKDAIIENLEAQVQKFKDKLAPRKKDRKISTTQERPQQQQLQKHKERSSQLQQQVYELMQQVDNLRNENLIIKQQISNTNKIEKRLTHSIHNESTKIQSNDSRINDDEDIYSPIEKLVSKKRRKINAQNIPNDDWPAHYRLLVSKCSSLQNQIEKLLTKYEKLKLENMNLRQIKPMPKCLQQVADQPNIYF